MKKHIQNFIFLSLIFGNQAVAAESLHTPTTAFMPLPPRNHITQSPPRPLTNYRPISPDVKFLPLKPLAQAGVALPLRGEAKPKNNTPNNAKSVFEDSTPPPKSKTGAAKMSEQQAQQILSIFAQNK